MQIVRAYEAAVILYSCHQRLPVNSSEDPVTKHTYVFLMLGGALCCDTELCLKAIVVQFLLSVANIVTGADFLPFKLPVFLSCFNVGWGAQTETDTFITLQNHCVCVCVCVCV